MNQFRLSVVRQETSEFYKLSNLTPDGKASHSYKDSQAIEEHDDFAEIEGCPTTKSGCADNPFCGSCNTGCSSGCDEGGDEKASCRETCDRAVELIRRHNAKKCSKIFEILHYL